MFDKYGEFYFDLEEDKYVNGKGGWLDITQNGFEWKAVISMDGRKEETIGPFSNKSELETAIFKIIDKAS